MDLLITGANGQLGHQVARLSGRKGLQALALTREQLDICDRAAVDALVERIRPKVIVNAAAYTAVDKAETDSELAYAINRDGPGYLAEAAETAGSAIVHISTDYVFDGTKTGPYTEEDPVAPLGVYGQSKEAGERAVREATDRHFILRTAWVFDTHGKNFVKTMLRLAAERDGLGIVDDQKGSPTYAADLAEVVMALAERQMPGTQQGGGFGTFHCAGGAETTWCGFARTIFDLAQTRLDRVPAVRAISTAEFPTPARRPANSVLDCGRLEQVHGLRLRPWQDALKDMLDSLETA